MLFLCLKKIKISSLAAFIGGITMDNHSIETNLSTWMSSARNDEEFLNAIKKIDFNLCLHVTDLNINVYLNICQNYQQPLVATQVSISASIEAWGNVLQGFPKPGFQSFTAIINNPSMFEVREDIEFSISRAMAAIERIFEINHSSIYKNDNENRIYLTFNGLSSIAGRYKNLCYGQVSAKIYYEQVGEDNRPAVLFLHTAGADSRQYLDVMSCDQLTQEWSCYTFDMPFHGKSTYPNSYEFGEYKLKLDEYVSCCLSFIETVIGRPTIVVGCSMGAAVCMALAATKTPLISGVVGVGTPDRSPGRLSPHLDHPAINASRYCGSYVRGMMSPTTPLHNKRFASWIYSQSGPGVYPGDLFFYSNEYNGNLLVDKINSTRCPVSLLTGEYDFSAPPESTERMYSQLDNASFKVIKGVGHFPMIEQPTLFLNYLIPELRKF